MDFVELPEVWMWVPNWLWLAAGCLAVLVVGGALYLWSKLA